MSDNTVAIFLKPLILYALSARKIKGLRKNSEPVVMNPKVTNPKVKLLAI